MPGIIGKKIGMTSLFDEQGKNIACTIVEVGPCVVTQVKTGDTDGYEAIQLAWDNKKEKHTTKAMQGHFKKAGSNPMKKIVEFSGFQDDVKLGDTIDATLFTDGEWVDVVGTSKGKGFQGVVKRHGFGGVGQSTHGQHNRGRAPGSIGAASYPARVFKGMRMAGQMGNKRVKAQNIQIHKVMGEQNLLVLKGSIPGPKGGYILIEK